MIMQFVAHVAIIKLAKWIVNQIVQGMSNRPSSRAIQPYNLDGISYNKSTTTLSPSISSTELDVTSLEKYILD